MSDEFDSNEPYSFFWPLLILLVGLLLWSSFQVYEVNKLRVTYAQQIETSLPTINAAQGWSARYNQMMQDLVQTAQKDQAAVPIAKEAVQAGVQAGLLRVNQNADTNSMANPAAPAPAK